MIVNIVDKLLFGLLLLLVFQAPMISDHYLQYVSGYYESTKLQVNGFEENAKRHKYPDVDAMISDLLNNRSPVVRMDAEQKLQTMNDFYDLKSAIVILKSGNIFEKLFFILNPSRYSTLKKVLANFKPGIPLSVTVLAYSIILALLLNFVIISPVRYMASKLKNP